MDITALTLAIGRYDTNNIPCKGTMLNGVRAYCKEMSAFLILFFREYFWLIVIGVVVVLVGLGRIIRHRMRPKANGKLVVARPVAARNVRRNPDPEQMQILPLFCGARAYKQLWLFWP